MLTRPTLILAIRLSALAVLCLWLYPSGIGWLPVAFFMPGCVCCPTGTPCPTCSGGLPSGVQVSISGITNGTCTNCTVANAVWISSGPATIGSNCSWSWTFPSPACSGAVFTGGIGFFYNTTNVQVSVTEIASPTSVNTNFRSTQSAGYTCNQDFLAIPHLSSSAACDGSSATVDVTMIP